MIYLLVAIVISLTVASLMVYVALQHNPQGEFCAYAPDMASCEYQYGAISSVFLGWLFASLVALGIPVVVWCVVEGVIGWVRALLKR